MEQLYSCRKFALCSLFVLLVILSTEAGFQYFGPGEVEEGEAFELECQVTPFDPIKWTVNGERVPGGETTPSPPGQYQVRSRLRVAVAGPEHSGEYRCSTFLSPGHRVFVLGVSKVDFNYNEDGGYVSFEYKQKLTLQCTVNGSNAEGEWKWTKDGAAVDTNNERLKLDKNTLTLSGAVETDAGSYTCTAPDGGSATAKTVLKPWAKLPAHSSVVEGEKLTITCMVFGNPVPNIMWTVGNQTFNESGDRVKLLQNKESKVPKAILQIEDANMEDRENYTCIAETRVGNKVFNYTTSTYVRVKDKMAALWPFLGICIEVIVLCTVILVYEKKRNKTEMEESDTDGSPEQKNTPDHGKDSEVRHRK